MFQSPPNANSENVRRHYMDITSFKIKSLLHLIFLLLIGCNSDNNNIPDDKTVEYTNKVIETSIINNCIKNSNDLSNIGQDSLAIIEIDKAIKLRPDLLVLYAHRGSFKIPLLKYESALEDLNKALTVIKNDEAFYGNRGYVHFKLGHYKEALEDAEVSIKLNPNFAKAYTLRGGAKYKLFGKNFGCDDFQKASELGDIEAKKYCGQCEEYNKKHNIK